MDSRARSPDGISVAIVGLGSIGKAVARRLSEGIPALRLTAVAVRDPVKASAFIASLPFAPEIVPIAEIARHADVVIECAPADALPEIAGYVLAAGKKLVVLSVGALLQHPGLELIARDNKGQILIPTGALIGLDAVRAAAEGIIHSVRLVTRKPVAGLTGAPYLLQTNLNLQNIVAPLQVFSGSARQAAQGFPSNLNVAAALALAGIGADRTLVEIWADPAATRNVHHIEVDSDSARFSMTIENIPSENPRTGRITALSVIALLRTLTACVKIGT
jgi:aspartate dehydrogenase